MKKFIFTIALSLLSLNSFAMPAMPCQPTQIDATTIDLDGITFYPLSMHHFNKLKIYLKSSGAASAGLCSIIIRASSPGSSGDYDLFSKVADKFKFTKDKPGHSGSVTPINAGHALIFKIIPGDFLPTSITMETKDGSNIDDTVAQFKDYQFAVLGGTCIPDKAKSKK